MEDQAATTFFLLPNSYSAHMLVMTSIHRNQPLQKGTVLILQLSYWALVTNLLMHKNVPVSSDGGLGQSVYEKESNALGTTI